MVGRDHCGSEIEDEKEKPWKQDDRAAKNSAGELGDEAEKRQAEGDAPGLKKPGMNTEEAEAGSVEQVSARRHEFEEVPVENLPVKDVYSAGEEDGLVIVRDDGSGGEEKRSQIQKCRRPGDGESEISTGKLLSCTRRDFCHWRTTLFLRQARRPPFPGISIAVFGLFLFGEWVRLRSLPLHAGFRGSAL